MARTATHPGAYLAEQPEALDLSVAELGRQLRVPGDRISQIVTGHRAITRDTALRLGHFFGTRPHLWLNLQATYGLRVVEEKLGATIWNLPRLTGRQKRKVNNHVVAV